MLNLPQSTCLHSPDSTQISLIRNHQGEDISVAETNLAEWATTSTVYLATYSAEVTANNRDIEVVNLSPYLAHGGQSLPSLSLYTYMSYFFFLRKVTVRPDESAKDTLMSLTRDHLLGSKKKRSRTTLNSGGIGGNVSVDEEDSPAHAAPAGGLKAIKEDGGEESPENSVIKALTLPSIEVNTGIVLRTFFNQVAEQFGAHHPVDAERLLLVPCNSRQCNVNWQHYVSPSAFATPIMPGGRRRSTPARS